MSHYKNVLVAIDGSDESVKIVQKALDLIAGSGAKLSVALVFETLVGNYSYELNMGDFQKVQHEFQEQVSKHAREMLKSKFPSIAAADVHFLRGKAGNEIKRLAASLKTDLVVIGSHGQGAVSAAVLGSTANSVLHGIHCDVYTVRV
ncbi:MAG: universal stress protein [Gammaproteobacteria bacterium]|nr:universal stress protein [Gammaproteobacteria bacterium]